MAYKFNPFTGKLDDAGSGGGGTPGGSTTQVQFNDGGTFGGDVDLTWNKTTNVMTVAGDLTLDDGVAGPVTTLQTITPTQNNTISLPNATGTVALVAGSSGQPIYNNAGAYAGLSTATIGATGNISLSLNGALNTPPVKINGTWVTTGGTGESTKPQVLIEPAGTSSINWSPSGTGLGVNAASTFSGNLLDLQRNGSSIFSLTPAGSDSLQIRTPLRYEYYAGANFVCNILSGGFALGSSRLLMWLDGNGGANGSDLSLARDAANTLAQRNGTNAQTFRVYGTESSSLANYVRASLSSTSTAVTLAAETAGTGADDIPLNLTAAGTGTVKANSNLELADAKDIVLATTTGTKIGTSTSQKLGFYNKTPVVQPTAVADITTTATAGTLPTPDGTVTIADAATPTVTELLEYCVELEAKLEAALGRLRDLGLIAT